MTAESFSLDISASAFSIFARAPANVSWQRSSYLACRKSEVESGQQMYVVYQVCDADGRVVCALCHISLRAALADGDQLNEAIKDLVVAQRGLGFRRGSTLTRVCARQVVHHGAQHSMYSGRDANRHGRKYGHHGTVVEGGFGDGRFHPIDHSGQAAIVGKNVGRMKVAMTDNGS